MRSLLVTSRKAQIEMRLANEDRLVLLEDCLTSLLDIKEGLMDDLEAPSSDGIQIQASGKLYQRLLKKRYVEVL